MTVSVAFVGTGDPDGEGYAMAYTHARAYQGIDDSTLVGCADVVRKNAERFAAEFGLPRGNVFEDSREMLGDLDPDVVSVTVPPAAHADVVVDCARAGVEAVHCEKPMADTWGASRLMAQECRRRGVQLTFNHQRRFSPRWRRAKELLDEGRIGALRRVETGCPNLYDWGTHAVDLANWYNDQRQIEWVLANVDYRTEQVLFGEHNENQALVLWEYENGVHGVASTGEVGSRAVGCLHRLVGAEGTIEVCGGGGDGPPLRLRRHGGPGWERVDVPDESFERAVGRAIADAVQSLETGEEPALSARRALDATELIFGAYESARRRGRVEFPLDVDDNPLAAMVEAGDLRPEPGDEE